MEEPWPPANIRRDDIEDKLQASSHIVSRTRSWGGIGWGFAWEDPQSISFLLREDVIL